MRLEPAHIVAAKQALTNFRCPYCKAGDLIFKTESGSNFCNRCNGEVVTEWEWQRRQKALEAKAREDTSKSVADAATTPPGGGPGDVESAAVAPGLAAGANPQPGQESLPPDLMWHPGPPPEDSSVALPTFSGELAPEPGDGRTGSSAPATGEPHDLRHR
jgi:hypothetical protein